jgi:hypothetical protein
VPPRFVGVNACTGSALFGVVAAVVGVVLSFLGVSWAGAALGVGAVAGAKGSLMLKKDQNGTAAEKADPET